jgi:hypothetical protein
MFKEITKEDRKKIPKKLWKPYYDQELSILVLDMEDKYSKPLPGSVMKILKGTAKVCAMNKAIMVQTHE